MRIYSSDPTLTALASELDLIAFEMTDADYEEFNELYHSGNLINVARYPRGIHFRVRLCLGGKQRTVGITKRGPEAARFADMARLFFWPHRLRDLRLPQDSDFNYGLAATKAALEDNDVARRVLERIRQHLIGCAELKEATDQSNEERRERNKAKEVRRTARWELQRFLAEHAAERIGLSLSLKTFEKALETSIKDNTHSFDQIKQAFQHLTERLSAVEADLKTANQQRAELRALITTKPLDFSLPADDIKAP